MYVYCYISTSFDRNKADRRVREFAFTVINNDIKTAISSIKCGVNDRITYRKVVIGLICA